MTICQKFWAAARYIGRSAFSCSRQLVVELRVLRQDGVALERPDQLGDRGVRVPPREHVAAGREVPEQRHLVERLGGLLEVRVAAAAGVELVEGVVHAAVLGAQHDAGVRERRDAAVEVLPEALGDLERLVAGRVVDVLVDVEEAGQHLVQVVVGHDHRVVGGATALDRVERGVAERADVALAGGPVVRRLHLGEALDGVDDLLVQPGLHRRGPRCSRRTSPARTCSARRRGRGSCRRRCRSPSRRSRRRSAASGRRSCRTRTGTSSSSRLSR